MKSPPPSPEKELQELIIMPVESDRVPVKEPEEAQYLEDAEEPESTSEWRNLIGFWILGLCNNYGYVIMLSAAHDILAHHDPSKHVSDGNYNNATLLDPNKRDCNYMSTGAILLADIIPSLLTKIISPFFPLYVHVRMFLMIVLSCAGYILVGASQTQAVAILGVVATAFSSGLGEATLLSYMPFFKNKNVISTWSSGTGGAGFFGSLSYATLTGLGLSPAMTLYVMLVVPALMSITFWIVLDRPKLEDAGSQNQSEANFNSTLSNDQIPLTLSNDSFWEKLQSIPPLFKYMIPLGLVYFFEYFINQGLFELIYFNNIFIDHNAQYRWYQVTYQIGVFFSRSSINLMKIDAIWLMAVLQGVNVIFFTFESLFSFLPNIYVVLAAVLWEGLLGGAAYVNTFYKINKEVIPEKREFSMAITSLADALGITLAGFLSMPVHNYICGLPKNLGF
ncbi:battenin isoform X2 [Macrosteles quadrilineatus]|uniref:battenin isoform X2 n=1 Tax=Macrosteles quadrilineatus TaxID=74068 RepID=UPI0023E10B72|nr:battenin isoform X2 [Macrosteles quadrilineatus]